MTRFDAEISMRVPQPDANPRQRGIDLNFFPRRFGTSHREAVTEFRLTNRAYRHAIT